MDFIEKLPSSSEFDTILVIVDWLTKQMIFISAHDTIMSADLAHLFVLHVFSKHSIPSHVISNRGLEFVSNFFYFLGTALDMQLYFTSGYHPEGDEQNTQIRLSDNTSMYIVTTSKTTGLNSYLSWSLLFLLTSSFSTLFRVSFQNFFSF